MAALRRAILRITPRALLRTSAPRASQRARLSTLALPIDSLRCGARLNQFRPLPLNPHAPLIQPHPTFNTSKFLANFATGPKVDLEQIPPQLAPPVLLSAVEGIQELLCDGDRTARCVAEIHKRVLATMREGRLVNSDAALDSVLSHIEGDGGFSPRLVTLPKALYEKQFLAVLSEGFMFEDAAFNNPLVSAHGVWAHRFQWAIVHLAMTQFAKEFWGAIRRNPPSTPLLTQQIFQTAGRLSWVSEDDKVHTIQARLFDRFESDFRSPETLRLSTQLAGLPLP